MISQVFFTSKHSATGTHKSAMARMSYLIWCSWSYCTQLAKPDRLYNHLTQIRKTSQIIWASICLSMYYCKIAPKCTMAGSNNAIGKIQVKCIQKKLCNSYANKYGFLKNTTIASLQQFLPAYGQVHTVVKYPPTILWWIPTIQPAQYKSIHTPK